MARSISTFSGIFGGCDVGQLNLTTTGRSLTLAIVIDERVADGVKMGSKVVIHTGKRGDGDRGSAVLLSLEVECEDVTRNAGCNQ